MRAETGLMAVRRGLPRLGVNKSLISQVSPWDHNLRVGSSNLPPAIKLLSYQYSSEYICYTYPLYYVQQLRWGELAYYSGLGSGLEQFLVISD